MKTLLFIVVSATMLLSGCKSKEEKANELIKDDMFKVLYDFASYEPIETNIDSAFTSVYTDSIITRHAYFIKIAIEKADEYLDEERRTKKPWRFGVMAILHIVTLEYYEAKNKFNENLEKAKACTNMVTLHSDSIKDRANFIKKEFCGWKATHKFRCKTKGGSPDIGNYEYIFDKDFKEIINKEDLDDKDYTKIKELINEVLESKKESDETDSKNNNENISLELLQG